MNNITETLQTYALNPASKGLNWGLKQYYIAGDKANRFVQYQVVDQLPLSYDTKQTLNKVARIAINLGLGLPITVAMLYAPLPLLLGAAVGALAAYGLKPEWAESKTWIRIRPLLLIGLSGLTLTTAVKCAASLAYHFQPLTALRAAGASVASISMYQKAMES